MGASVVDYDHFVWFPTGTFSLSLDPTCCCVTDAG